MPKSKLLLPKFLTRGVAESAIVAAVDMTFRAIPVKREMLHVVVLVPAMDFVSDSWPNYPLKPHCIAQMSFGDKAQWPHKFDEIAQCKSLQLWHDRNNGGTDIMPHLLILDDTPFWGGVKRDGIVVACSGVQPWFDRMISGITADICIARAYDEKMKWAEKNPDADFV